MISNTCVSKKLFGVMQELPVWMWSSCCISRLSLLLCTMVESKQLPIDNISSSTQGITKEIQSDQLVFPGWDVISFTVSWPWNSLEDKKEHTVNVFGSQCQFELHLALRLYNEDSPQPLQYNFQGWSHVIEMWHHWWKNYVPVLMEPWIFVRS